jgi:hypothetical protein
LLVAVSASSGGGPVQSVGWIDPRRQCRIAPAGISPVNPQPKGHNVRLQVAGREPRQPARDGAGLSGHQAGRATGTAGQAGRRDFALDSLVGHQRSPDASGRRNSDDGIVVSGRCELDMRPASTRVATTLSMISHVCMTLLVKNGVKVIPGGHEHLTRGHRAGRRTPKRGGSVTTSSHDVLVSLLAEADSTYGAFRALVIDQLPDGAALDVDRLTPSQQRAVHNFHRAEQELSDYREAMYRGSSVELMGVIQ